MYSALLWFVAGCSGINTTQSASPASILPFLLQANPIPAHPDRLVPAADPVKQIAQN